MVNSKRSKLKQTGIPVDGIIVERDIGNSYYLVKDKITIRFVTLNQEWITALIDQDFQVSYTGQYKEGETVKVYYDKDNPSNFYVDTKQSELKGKLIAAVVGLAFVLCGLYELFV